MGDRLNIIILQEKPAPPVVVYSHNGGCRLLRSGIPNAIVEAEGHRGDPNYYTAAFLRSVWSEVSGIGTTLDDTADHDTVVIESATGVRLPDLDSEAAHALLRRWVTSPTGGGGT